jgi:transcription elongation factor GreA
LTGRRHYGKILKLELATPTAQPGRPFCLYREGTTVSDIEVSQQGYERLAQELEQLRRVSRPQAREQIRRAREYGDLSENFEYHIAKDEQGHIEARITELEIVLSRAKIVQVPTEVSHVSVHTRVRLKNLENGRELEYAIVPPQEANSTERKLSVSAPVPQALLSHAKGDVVVVDIPKGKVRYEILDVLPLEN